MSIMDAKDKCKGQSIFEFVFMLPLLFILTTLAIKSATAIQISINNQRYARAQALWLTFNAPNYPERDRFDKYTLDQGYNQIVVGVSDEPFGPNATQDPLAPSIRVSRNGAKKDPKNRDEVKVKTTVALCTQTKFIEDGGKFVELNSNVITDKLQEAVYFCRSPMRL